MKTYEKFLNPKYEFLNENEEINSSKQKMISLKNNSGKIRIAFRQAHVWFDKDKFEEANKKNQQNKPLINEKSNENGSTKTENQTNPSNETEKEDNHSSTSDENHIKTDAESDSEMTYYDKTLQNKLFLLVQIYDDEYEDQHNLVMATEIFLSTKIKKELLLNVFLFVVLF